MTSVSPTHAASFSKPHRRREPARKRPKIVDTRPDWVLVALPTALAVHNLYTGPGGMLVTVAFILIVGLPVLIAFMRQTGSDYQLAAGPLVALFGSSFIVLTRPTGIYNVLVFLLVGALAIQLARTVYGPRMISSLFDGVGVYALVSVLLYGAGIRSATESEGWRLYLDTDGVNRIIFPLDRSLNLPPILAAMYISAFYLMIREPGRWRRVLRTICLIAAVLVLIGSGARVPAFLALVVPLAIIVVPAIARWIAPLSVAFAACSAVILPRLIASTETVLSPLVALVSDRPATQGKALAALNGRDYVWEKSLTYWQEEVHGLINIMFGYGMQGHYRSGVSLTYYRLLSHVIVHDPDKLISVHNSFLQQLFDGGLVGFGLLAIALFWASVRISSKFTTWGNCSAGAAVMLSVIALCSTTEILLHQSAITYWLVIILVAVACQQSGTDRSNPDPPPDSAQVRPYDGGPARNVQHRTGQEGARRLPNS